MRAISLGAPPQDPAAFRDWVIRAFRQIEIASNDIAAEKVADAFTVSNLTETRALDVSAATASDVAEVLGTLLSDLKRRGSKRTSL